MVNSVVAMVKSSNRRHCANDRNGSDSDAMGRLDFSIALDL